MSNSQPRDPYDPHQPYEGQPGPYEPYDQQHYGQAQHQDLPAASPQGPGSYGQDAYGQGSYGGEPYAQQAYGEPSYGQQAPHPAAHGHLPGQPTHERQAYDPYAQQQHQPQAQQHQPQAQRQQHHAPGPVSWPTAGQPGRQDGYGYPQDGQQQPPADHRAPHTPAPQDDGPQTQIWSAPTWDTSVQAAIREPEMGSDAAETAYLPPQQAAPRPAPAPQEPAATPAPAPSDTGSRPEAPVDLSRLAPNQRARAEGRSPIIPPGFKPAALTAVLALLLALTAPLARPVLAVPVALLQAVTAAGWFRLNGMWPARQGIALAFLAGLTADIALLATDRESAPVVAIGTLGVWCLFVLVLQLRNRSSADERMYALTAGLASTALTVLAAGQLAADADAVVVGAAGVAVAALARALPLPSAASVVVALLAATGAGIAAGQLTDLGASGALLGLAAGACALIGLRVASYDYPSRFVHMTAGVALPLALAAPAVYVLGRALG